MRQPNGQAKQNGAAPFYEGAGKFPQIPFPIDGTAKNFPPLPRPFLPYSSASYSFRPFLDLFLRFHRRMDGAVRSSAASSLGNGLVIVSVLRFKALHSAINFLILGLAIADLGVALFVMPTPSTFTSKAVVGCSVSLFFVFSILPILPSPGPLMCNLYLSSDVACSTASIILLALISFDRYQAISHPIQYSRQAQNIARVVRLFVGVWVYSLLVASPIVLGFNDPPPEESASGAFEPFECRFYNPWFSMLSSFVSFLLPCSALFNKFNGLFATHLGIASLFHPQKVRRSLRITRSKWDKERETRPITRFMRQPNGQAKQNGAAAFYEGAGKFPQIPFPIDGTEKNVKNKN
ncbi:hypothetical protein niasHT_037769 [Heterodera trifolii]|uniref:G-protein coupled receptors family 1 profile domain-containing protein n=1 Tax=Heterodera trifolii TaxID=157864 RepID=A0ABD2J7S7_9BILA